MTRVDELTLRLIDGEITAAERAELERLVRESPEAERAHEALLDVAAALRAGSPPPDVAGDTLARIHERITEKIEVGVLHKIRARGTARPASTRRVAKPRPGPVWILALAAAAAVAVIAAVLWSPRTPDGPEARNAPRKVEGPKTPEAPPAAAAPVPAPREERPAPAPEPPEPERPAPPEKKPAPPAAPEEKKPEPKPEPKPEGEPAPPPPKPVPPTETILVVATLERAEGASILANGQKKPAKAGQDLLQGDGLETDGSATVKFPDGTRLELRGKALVRELSNKPGKAIDFARGILSAQVAEQAVDRPMVVATPLAEVRVVGTAFRLSVDPDAENATHLEVFEGKVRVKRLQDGKILDVGRGSTAAVVRGAGPLAVQPRTGLVGHWKLDDAAGGTALDSSGNLLHGVVRGDATWVAGRLGGALRFGPGASLSLPGVKVPETFTVSFWVFQAALDNEQDWYLTIGKDFQLMREGNMERRQIRTGFESPQEFLFVSSAVQPGQWVHLAATYDGAELRLFTNGQSVGSKKIARREARGEPTFGKVAAGSGAVLDDIRIYDHALSAQDVARVLAGGSPAAAPRK